MKLLVLIIGCALFTAGCQGASSPSTGSSNAGGGTSVGNGPIGSTSSSSILMQNIKNGDANR